MTATVTLSMEVELAWGSHDKSGQPPISDDALIERETLESLIEACSDADVPFTFDIVGHLCHYSCDGSHESPHKIGWFDADPGTDLDANPEYYAPDIIEELSETSISHEICTHTYSHALCDEIGAETLDWELQRSHEEFQEIGVELSRSMVPPRHREPPKSVLLQHDIDVIRLIDPESEEPDQGPVRTFLWLLTKEIPTSTPKLVDGVIETYVTPAPSLSATYLKNGQNNPHLAFRLLPVKLRQKLHRYQLQKSLEEAIETDSHIHLWTHLNNIANKEQWKPIEDFIYELGQRSEADDIEIKTMGDLWDNFE